MFPVMFNKGELPSETLVVFAEIMYTETISVASGRRSNDLQVSPGKVSVAN